jgi:hypothetical protein
MQARPLVCLVDQGQEACPGRPIPQRAEGEGRLEDQLQVVKSLDDPVEESRDRVEDLRGADRGLFKQTGLLHFELQVIAIRRVGSETS